MITGEKYSGLAETQIRCGQLRAAQRADCCQAGLASFLNISLHGMETRREGEAGLDIEYFISF